MEREPTEKKGRPFEPGNKFGRGRPRGSRNKKSLLAQELLYSHSEALIKKALMEAIKGDSPLLRTLLSYVLRRGDPPSKTGPLRMSSAAELSQTIEATLQRVAAGKITLPEAQRVFDLIETSRRVIETQHLEQRVCAIEEAVAKTDSR